MGQAFLITWLIPLICAGGSSIFETVSSEGQSCALIHCCNDRRKGDEGTKRMKEKNENTER
jgi:hypothetical protein